MRQKISLRTQQDVLAFSKIVEAVDGEVRIVGHDRGQECSINGKSLLGLLYCTTWTDLWCVSEHDIRPLLTAFIDE